MKLRQLCLACGVGVVILTGIVIDRALYQVPAADSYPYHAKVREAATLVPETIGDWKSKPVEVPTSAQKMLRSNVLISREYFNPKSGQQASFLFVQCSDARDLLGHYPAVCYPNAGYTLVAALPDERVIPRVRPSDSDVAALGTNYKFTQETLNLKGSRAMWVYNVMILPNGLTASNMGGVDSIARNRRMRYFGAAEIQVITDVGMAEADRSHIINMLLESSKPLIDAIRSGVQ